MLIKVDLEKLTIAHPGGASETLEKAGFPGNWVRNVMSCLETSKMSVLWNGKRLEWLKPIREIRQGDVISSYLFVLCMERLRHIIRQAVSVEI